MKKIILTVLLLILPLVCVAQDATAKAIPKADIRITIETDKKVYSVGDEIVLTLSWENLSNKEVLIYFREDQLLQGMLSFQAEDGRSLMPPGTMLIEMAPQLEFRIPAKGSFSYRLKGKLQRENFTEPSLIESQRFYGNFILKFEDPTPSKLPILPQLPILLGKLGKLRVILHYGLSADSYLAKHEPSAWTGTITSDPAIFEVKEKK